MNLFIVRLKTLILTILLFSLVSNGIADESLRLPDPPQVNTALSNLGKHLFFDPRLSGDAELSCATCHQPEHGFSDGKALSKAYTGMKGFRNSPTLINTVFRDVWMHDGRLGTNLNDVTREMLTESWLMNMDMRLMQERLKQIPDYVQMFEEAGLGEPSNGGVRKAIPEYLKTLISQDVPFDQGKLSESAQRGQELFSGKAGCHQCHSGARFTDDQPHNIGVPENPEIFNDPIRHLTYVTFAKFMGVANPMALRRDVGAHVRTHRADKKDVGSFITPTLRELVHTKPYMHNGIFESLEAVIEFYNEKSRLAPLHLSKSEKEDLIEFLKSLSGSPLTGETYVAEKPDGDDYPVIENWREVSN